MVRTTNRKWGKKRKLEREKERDKRDIGNKKERIEEKRKYVY